MESCFSSHWNSNPNQLHPSHELSKQLSSASTIPRLCNLRLRIFSSRSSIVSLSCWICCHENSTDCSEPRVFIVENLSKIIIGCGLTAMTRTDTDRAIFLSAKPGVAAILAQPGQPLQTCNVRRLLHCKWRGESRYQSADGLVCPIRTASLQTGPQRWPYPQPPVTSAWRVEKNDCRNLLSFGVSCRQVLPRHSGFL